MIGQINTHQNNETDEAVKLNFYTMTILSLPLGICTHDTTKAPSAHSWCLTTMQSPRIDILNAIISNSKGSGVQLETEEFCCYFGPEFDFEKFSLVPQNSLKNGFLC